MRKQRKEGTRKALVGMGESKKAQRKERKKLNVKIKIFKADLVKPGAKSPENKQN